MSVMVKDSLGRWVQAAGQGKAEYGASTERKGDITIPATTAGNFQTVNVIFAQAMPDNDYTVIIDEGGNTWAHCTTNVTNKTATGFTLFFLNVAGADAPQMTFKYRAFKLYTDTEYNQVLAALPPVDSVTDGNMKAVTSNAVYDALSNVVVTTADTVADGNMNPVTSNAVYDALQSMPHFLNNGAGIELHGEVSYADLIKGFSDVTDLTGGHLFHFGFYHEGNDSNDNWVVGRLNHIMTFGKPNEIYDTYSDGIEQTINLTFSFTSNTVGAMFNIHNRLSNNTTLTRGFKYYYNKTSNKLDIEIMDENGDTLYEKTVNNSSDWASFAPNISTVLSQIHAQYLSLTIEQII